MNRAHRYAFVGALGLCLWAVPCVGQQPVVDGIGAVLWSDGVGGRDASCTLDRASTAPGGRGIATFRCADGYQVRRFRIVAEGADTRDVVANTSPGRVLVIVAAEGVTLRLQGEVLGPQDEAGLVSIRIQESGAVIRALLSDDGKTATPIHPSS